MASKRRKISFPPFFHLFYAHSELVGPGTAPLGTRWILVTKTDQTGFVNKFKARLVVKGYSQIHGIDYEETFAPVP